MTVLRCRGVADSLEEAGDRLFTFLRYPPQQWKSLRTTVNVYVDPSNEAALLAFADYRFDGKFGHRGDAWGVFFYRTEFGVVVTIDGSRILGHGFVGSK